ALGRSRGGFSTKIHAIVDAKGRPLHVALTPGERHELIAAPELLDYAGDAVIGDTGYDSNEFRAEVKVRGIKAVINSKPERKRAIPKDRKLYAKRYWSRSWSWSWTLTATATWRWTPPLTNSRRNFAGVRPIRATCSVFNVWTCINEPSNSSPSSTTSSTRCREATP